MPKILEAAKAAGAKRAGYTFLRLPGSVAKVFEERLRASLPLSADKVLSRVREARGGKLYDSRFGVRGRGEGHYADTIRSLFDQTTRRLGLNETWPEIKEHSFVRPGRGHQLPLL
jgi:DNA repair photolyase